METAYTAEYFAFVDLAHAASTNAAMARVTGNPADSGTFSVPCSGTGAGPATHLGTVCPATPGMVQALEGAYASGHLPGVTFYRCSRPGGTLLATNSASQASINQAWTWEQALTDAGLQVIVTGMIPGERRELPASLVGGVGQ